MSPFLSFFATKAVAHFFRSKLDAALADGVEVPMLAVGLLELVDREELLVLLELVDEPLLDDRSSLRFSSSR